jgi:hypothetical protein
VVTDVVRDSVDWIVVGVGVLSALIGVIAIIVALRANSHAKQAERKAIQRARPSAATSSTWKSFGIFSNSWTRRDRSRV